jgi:autotransporter passenger strand-loop-strand repeat protein
LSSGYSLSDTISAGATQFVYAAGSASDATVLGSQYVYGAAAGDLITGNDAYQFVESGGSAVNDTVVSQGYQSALSGGVTIGTTVSSGGVEWVLSGGLASSSTVLSAGLAIIEAGATATAAES